MGRTPGAKNKPKDQTMTTTKTASATERVADQATSKGEVAIFNPPRLPYHPAIKEAFGIDKGTWKVLVDAIFPAAKTADAIGLALSYCKARNLDPLKRPVHIVPMWDSARGAYIETVWPGISELRTTASRTAGYAGCDVAEFGDSVTMDFNGRLQRRGNWEEQKVTVEFPEWCRITVYRIVGGQRCKFVGPKVAWLETYATQGASDLPNKMWQERPEGQLEKCAEAAALRRAFPEELGSELTAEEMVGRNVHDINVDIPAITDQATVAAGDRDQAPPRAAPPAEAAQPDPEQARDGTPPRRPAKTEPKAEPKKEDPISTGPQRAPKDAGPKERPIEPFKISGAGETFETWTEKYIDNIRTSPDTATVYKWIDLNSDPLSRLNKGKPSVYAKAKAEAERTMEKLRDAQKKAEEKAAKKAAPPPKETAPPAGDMEDPTGEPVGEMDGPEPGAIEFGAPASDNPEDILKWIEATLASVTEPEDLENIWTSECEPKIDGMFPPDQQEAQGIFRKHEKRLAP